MKEVKKIIKKSLNLLFLRNKMQHMSFFLINVFDKKYLTDIYYNSKNRISFTKNKILF